MTITPEMLAAAHALAPSQPERKVRAMLEAALKPAAARHQEAVAELDRHRQELAGYAATTQEALRQAQGEISFCWRVLADVGNALAVPLPDAAAAANVGDQRRQYGQAIRTHLATQPESPLPAKPDEPLSPNAMLHKLWTACVGQPGYSKEAWMQVELQLGAAGLLSEAHRRARHDAV